MAEPTLLAEMVSDFRQGFPDVPLASELDITEWKQSDPNATEADRPLFVTLPLVKVGTKSLNGLDWGRPEAEHLVREINTKRPEGGLGHIPFDKRSTEYKLPALRWVGAMLDAGGTVWAKAYVPKYASDVREFFMDAKRSRARVGTSVYGMQGTIGLRDMTLENIDIGHPDRISHPVAAAVPKLTSEMQDESTDKHGEANPMADQNEGKIVAELAEAKTKALQQVADLTSENTRKDSVISEMQGKINTLTSVEKLVSEFAGDTVTAKVEKLVSELHEARKMQKKAQIDGWIAEAIKAVELEDLRPAVKHELDTIAELGKVDSEATAKRLVTEYMDRPENKVIAEALRDKRTGPPAFVGGQSRNGGKDALKELEKSETIDAARRAMGV